MWIFIGQTCSVPRVYSWYKSTRAGLMSGLFILNVLSACFCLHWITTVQISFYMPLSDHEERKRRKKTVLVKILSVSSGWDVVKNVFILPSFIGLQLHFHKFLFSVVYGSNLFFFWLYIFYAFNESRHDVKKREAENASMMQMFGSICYLDNMLMKVCTF